MFIGVSGLIGAGKSTLTRDLSKELSRLQGTPWNSVYEPVKENPYLEDFYKDISRWTFNMQLYLLASRFRQHQEVIWDPAHRLGGGVVQDRTIYEDTIFARMHKDDGLMSPRDWDTYISHFEIMKGFLRYPDVIIYLRVSPELALERIESRARPGEAGLVPLDYLKKLHDGYEKFVGEMTRYTMVIPLDWKDFRDTTEVAQEILEKTSGESAQKFLRSLRRT